MGRWRGFLDSLDTDGGHIFVLFVLLLTGLSLYFYDATSGGTITIGAFSALLLILKSKGTNSEQIARAGTPYQPPQPPASSLTPPVVVAGEPLPVSTTAADAAQPGGENP